MPSLETMAKLCKLLKINVNYILCIENEKKYLTEDDYQKLKEYSEKKKQNKTSNK